MIRLRPHIFVAAATMLACASTVRGQSADPSLTEPVYHGERAWAVVPARDHVRNEGGADGKGLCVISSVLSDGLAQRVPGFNVPGSGTSNIADNWKVVPDAPGKGSKLWRLAKSRPGGYWPEKLATLLREIYGDGTAVPYGAHYISIQDNRPEVLESLSRKGYPIAMTTDLGGHMISVDHFRAGGPVIYHDNNDPQRWHVAPSADFLRRSYDRWTGKYWAFIWSDRPLRRGAVGNTTAYLVGAAVLLLVFLVPTPDSPDPEAMEPEGGPQLQPDIRAALAAYRPRYYR